MRTILFTSLFLLSSIYIQGQKKKTEILNEDSLLLKFQYRSPFDVLNQINIDQDFDYNSVYYNDELKKYLLMWLDKPLYIDYIITQDSIKFINNKTYIKRAIYNKLVSLGIKNKYDSILSNKMVYDKYVDSVVVESVTSSRKGFTPENTSLPYRAIYFHANLAYPEGYKLLKKYWADEKQSINSHFFIPLVKMGDPEATDLYNKRILEFIKSKGESYFYMELVNELLYIHNSYSFQKMIELLKVDTKYEMLSDGDEKTAFNCVIAGILQDDIRINKIDEDNNSIQKLPCNKLLKKEKYLIIYTNKLIELSKEKEQYWRNNMPYVP